MAQLALEEYFPNTRVLKTVPNRFYNDPRCEALFILPTTHMTTREMIETGRNNLQIKSADVLAVEKFHSSFKKGDPDVVDTVNLAYYEHGVRHFVIFRHQRIEGGRLFVDQSKRRAEDAAKKKAMKEAREQLRDTYKDSKVSMIYARFNGMFIELSQIFEDGSELIRSNSDNRFLTADGQILPCEATVITCVDYRQLREVRACVRDDFGIERFGLIGLPGSTKSFIKEGDHRISLHSIEKSVKTHGSRRVMNFHHADCRAYKGWLKYGCKPTVDDLIEEEKMHREQMYDMRKLIQSRIENIDVDLVYARFIDGGRNICFVEVDSGKIDI